MTTAKRLLAIGLIFLVPATALAQGQGQTQAGGDRMALDLLERKADEIDRDHGEKGIAYVISGSVALAGSIPGFYLSKDLFARAVFGVGEVIGIAAIGYGTHMMLIENDYSQFRRILRGVPELTGSEKNRLAHRFLHERAATGKSSRRIRVITHSLTGLLNIVNAVTAEDSELKTALYFLAGINALAAISFSINKSEEEKALELRPAPSRAEIGLGLRPELALRGLPELQLRFRF